MQKTSIQKKWWHGKIAYQIYPKSFKDSNGDGIGDIQGIISKLPYLHDLGVEIVWISPMYVSPLVDQGYDIADYEHIDPVFGTDADFDELVKKAKELGISIIMDLVVNHCSSEHVWFKKAIADKNSPYRDYFYFRQGKADGTPPDNLRSYFGGSVWEKVPNEDNTYYLHYFAKEQPDLNWYNPKVREEIYAMMNRWFERGIDGFRVDAIMNIEKDLSFPGLSADSDDGMASSATMSHKLSGKIGHFLNEMNEKTVALHDKFSVGEAFGVDTALYPNFIGDKGCFGTIFDFKPRELVEKSVKVYQRRPVNFTMFRDATFKSQAAANNVGFLAPVMENHDEPRGISYYIPKEWENEHGAKAFGTFLMMLRGIPFIYQGQELGLKNPTFNSIDEIDDLATHDMYRICIKDGLEKDRALALCSHETRDNARCPMPWDNSEYAGFSTVKPWLKNYSYKDELNVEAQIHDENSTYSYYKKLIAIRRDKNYQKIFTEGEFIGLLSSDLTAIYKIATEDRSIFVMTNLSDKGLKCADAFDLSVQTCSLLLETHKGVVSQNGNEITLAKGESAVFLLANR